MTWPLLLCFVPGCDAVPRGPTSRSRPCHGVHGGRGVHDGHGAAAAGRRGVQDGRPDPREDFERVKAVRKAIGDTIKLMVDVNTVWDLKTAIVWGRRLEQFDIAWLEEPMHPFDVRAHAELAKALDVPIYKLLGGAAHQAGEGGGARERGGGREGGGGRRGE